MRDQVATLNDQVRYLQAEGERKDAIIMTMSQRISELEPAREPAPEPRESPETASEEERKGDVPSDQEQSVSWWRKIFGA